MKEQTAKLANECGFDVDKTGTFGNYSEMRRLEKFAELIVRECADLVDRAISDGGVDGRILKEHFGVDDNPVEE